MSTQEFDRYLALLTKLLRLRSGQRDEIADELRDHFEQRLDELTAQGVSHDEAVRSALEEFGDAANLAHHFSHLSHVQFRRRTMRRALGTIAVITVVLLIAIAFWPHIPVPVPPAPQVIVAQAIGTPAPGGVEAGLVQTQEQAELAADRQDRAKIEQKLSQKVALDFVETPLQDAMMFLADQSQLTILIDRVSLAESSVPVDAPIDLSIGENIATLRTVLDLILEPLKLGFTIRGGIIYITTTNRAHEIVVYNVRDLLAEFQNMGLPGMAGGPFSSMPGGEGGFVGGPAGMMPAAMPGDGGRAMPGGKKGDLCFKLSETSSIPVVVAAMIEPDSWELNGGNGNITQYNGLMVVKNSQAVHAKIRRLLEMMRAAARQPLQ